MARGTVNRVIQVAAETVAGTPVAASKSLPSTSIELTREIDVKQYRALGFKGQTTTKIVKDFCTGKISGPLTYGEIVYPLAMLVTPVISTPPAGILTRQWLFTAFAQGADPFKTLTIQEGDSVAALQAAYSFLTQFGVELKEDDASISGSLLGQNLTAVSLTASPTSIALLPIGPREIDIYMDPMTSIAITAITLANPAQITATAHGFSNGDQVVIAGVTGTLGAAVNGTWTISGVAANTFTIPVNTTALSAYSGTGGTATRIGATKVTDALSASFGINNKQAAKWVLNTSNQSFKEPVEIVPAMSGMVLTEHNAQSRAFFAAISATNNPYYLIRMKATGPVIETVAGPITYNYTLTFDFPAQIIATKQEDAGGVWGYSYDLLPEYHAAFGNRLWESLLLTTLTAL